MRIYVDELPNSCEECPMCRSGKLKLQRKGRYVEVEQCVFGQYKYRTIDDEIDTCPLQSLADYTKQVRKEVCEEISWKLNRRLNGVVNGKYSDEFFNGYSYCSSDIENILDQLQGETKNAETK